ncbi:aldehyde dehydrogenase family protein [Nocardia pseudovaccinii]|uniref:aldehyde dehydrogenase family protein n=1 Tax=Nocardia pseudovaccinii TaxID=189540 RepID=UPI0007A52DEE|nr:aldehyde dehydrogenase family protein [Nocardia pseudovaccinii]
MDTPATIEVRNPRSGEIDYRITPPTEAELRDIAASLREAQRGWSARPLEERLEIMQRWANVIIEHATAIGAAEAADTGRHELSYQIPHQVAASIQGWCKIAPAILRAGSLEGRSSTAPNVGFTTQLSPYPLLGVISPWNHPFNASVLDAIPALIAGCAVLVKPSEIAPRFVEPVVESLRQVPELAAVFQYVTGDGRTGQQLIQCVDSVCFTGSVTNGRKVAEACAARFIPAFLEMGGKDAAIVTASADLDRAATSVLRSSAWCTGQICFSTERVYVEASVHDEFVAALVRKANELELSYPDPHAGHLGPFILGRQAATVDAHIDDALAKGARLVAGGKSQNLGGGHFMKAGVLVDVTHDMRIMTEETFGPVTPVMRYTTEEEALALANDSEYGLSAAVIAGDVAEARRLGEQLNAGAIALQDAGLSIMIVRDAEKNSFNQSGLGGSRMGPNGLLRYFRKKALIVNETEPMSILAMGYQ